jgi:hypothetical protein
MGVSVMLRRRDLIASAGAYLVANATCPDSFAQVRDGAGMDHLKRIRNQEKKSFVEAAMNEVMSRWLKEARGAVEELGKRGIHAHIPEPPKIVAFADWDYYYTADGQIIWEPNKGQNYRAVGVPVGFVSDLASVPRMFWSLLPRQGRYAYAAMIHDYLYWDQTRSRDEADAIFKIAMEDSEVDALKIEAMYRAVAMAGESYWKENARLKAAGEQRIMRRFPPSGNITWAAWRKEKGVF